MKIDQTREGIKVGIRIKPEKGNSIYASSTNPNEHTTAQQTIRKMSRPIEEYKEQRYHKVDSSHKSMI